MTLNDVLEAETRTGEIRMNRATAEDGRGSSGIYDAAARNNLK